MYKNFLFRALILLVVFSMGVRPVFSKEVNFAVVSDVNYSNIEHSLQDNSTGAKNSIVLKAFVDRVNENNYKFVIFLGDNLSKSNEKNLKGFLDVIKDINCPYYLVMGNQDVHKISGLDKKEYLQIVSQNSKFQKKKKESYYFSVNNDIIAIVLDGVSSGMPSNHGVFSKNTLSWLDEILTKNENKKVIIFQHVPYMPPYENPAYDILEKNDYRAVISRHDNIVAIFGGHYKKESAYRDDNGIFHINAPALYLDPYSYMDVNLKYKKPLFRKAKDFKFDRTIRPAI